MYPNPPSNPLPHLDYRWIFLASLLLSAWLVALDPLVNRDAIIYLRSADAYLQQGFAASQSEFGRPLLPILMAAVHKLTGLPLLHAGLALITLFYALMCVAFVATVHTLGGNRSVQLLAAVVVLSHPMLNQTRSSIMRDPAYWALTLLAFREMLLYLRHPGWVHQARWLVLIVLASLFRFEGLFLAVLSPLSLLFTRNLDNRVRHCLRLLLPLLTLTVATGGAILAYRSSMAIDTTIFPAIRYYVESLLSFPEKFMAVVAESAEPMLQFTAIDDAPIAVLAGLAAVLVMNIFRATTWVWVFTLFWSWHSRILERFRHDDAVVLWAHQLVTLAYLVLFTLINRFMLERYSSQLVIFLLLYVPFALNVLWRAGGWRKYLVLALLIGMSVDSLHTSDRDKAFIRDATEWIRYNTPEGANIVTNEKYIAYFSEREIDWKRHAHLRYQLGKLLTPEGLWRRADYLVLYVKVRDYPAWESFLQDHSLQELRTFPGGDRGRVSVVAMPVNDVRP